MALREPTRADDDAILAMISARMAGKSAADIADAHGVKGEFVRTATLRVRKADEKTEGQDLSHAYW